MQNKGKPCGNTYINIKVNAKYQKENTLFRWMRKIADGYLPELRIRKDILGVHISIEWINPIRHQTPWDRNYYFMKLVKDLKEFQMRSGALPPHLLMGESRFDVEALTRENLFNQALEEYNDIIWQSFFSNRGK